MEPIYTRRGDEGTTDVGDGTRVPKSHVRIRVYGALDEACALIGVARVGVTNKRLDDVLEFCQHRLYNCSSQLASGTAEERPSVSAEDVDALEKAIDFFTHRTGAIRCFILPAGNATATRLHFARTVARRAEREVLELAQSETVDEVVLAFLNRLSDVLFAAARYANNLGDILDETWDEKAERPELPL